MFYSILTIENIKGLIMKELIVFCVINLKQITIPSVYSI
jgi:hypothetical protein